MVRSSPKSKIPMGAQLGYEGIAQLLRERIVSGRWRAGQRLPTHRELEAEFRTTSVTVQSALSLLQEHEFVRAAGRLGSFVTDHPPHLHTYGLFFPSMDVEPRYFPRLALAAARVVFNSESRRLRWYDTSDQTGDPKNLRVCDDLNHHRVAGMVLTWIGGKVDDTPLYSPDCDVPRVALHKTPAGCGVPSVLVDFEAFFERAVERLAAEGRRKIACITVGNSDTDCVESRSALKRHGLEYRRYWHLNVGHLCYAAARTTTHLLMSLAPADRPDAFIIADDNLVEHAQAGLIDAGIKVPQDFEHIIAHCNWPEPPAAIFPLTRLGFDTTAMMRTCADLIDQQRRGVTPPELVMIKPVFEEEINAGSAVGSRVPQFTTIPALVAGDQ